jgi:hypothetical protein
MTSDGVRSVDAKVMATYCLGWPWMAIDGL